MEAFTDIVNLLQSAVVLIGLGTAIVGGILFGQAYTSDDASKKSVGVNTIIGGIIIAVIGFTIVPKLQDYIPAAMIQTKVLTSMQYYRSFL